MEVEYLGTHIIGGNECKVYKYKGEYIKVKYTENKLTADIPVSVTDQILEKIGFDVNQPYSVSDGIYEQVRKF